jgi:hypothetical protein
VEAGQAADQWRADRRQLLVPDERRSGVMHRRGFVVLGAVLAMSLSAEMASAEILDYGPWEPNIGEVGGASGSDAYAQSFIAPEENIVVVAGMYLYGGGDDPPAIRVDIWGADANGEPDATNIVAEGPIYQEYFPRLTLVTVEPENAVLTPGERYFVMLNGMIDQESSGYYYSTVSTPEDPYPDGNRWWTNDMGDSWVNSPPADFGFYIETVPDPAGGLLLTLGSLVFLRLRRR